MRMFTTSGLKLALLFGSALVLSCESDTSSSDGDDGTTGPEATDGTTDSTDSTDGSDGLCGTTGTADGSDSTDDAEGTDGTVGTDGPCEPFCAAGWECGSNGCGGECGTCTGGDICDQVKRTCEPPPAPLKQFGEACGDTATCTPETAGYPSCLHAQCDNGYCFGSVCTLNCELKKDSVDWSGAANPDGIEDPDAVASDCADPVEGNPYGATWYCIQNADPAQGSLRTCQAGTTFKPCNADSECPSGEGCQLLYVNGQNQKRCATAIAGSVDAGEYCNEDPANGDLVGCKSNLCLNNGSCSGFCVENADCGGTFMTCEKDIPLGETLTGDICLGKLCDSNIDCPGDSACNLGGNGEDGAAFQFENSCAATPAGAVAVGEACDGDPTDDVPGKACKGLCLGNDTCSTLCTSSSQCEGSTIPMFCNVNEATYDFDEDGTDEEIDAYGLCISVEGSKAECFKNADCSNGEACEFYQVWTENGAYDGIGYCTKPAAEGANEGELCGGDTGIFCKSGFCLPTFDSGAGICTALCSSTDDCAQGITPPGTEVKLNQLCQSLLYSLGGTFDDAKDNIYVPLCAASSDTDSLDDCSGDYACDNSEEACIALPHLFGAAGPSGVEYRCVDAMDADGKPYLKKLGESCDVESETPTAANSCEDLYCNADAKDGEGYCSKPCNVDADCSGGTPDMVCDTQTLRERASGENVTAKFCIKAKPCTPCGTDDECTDGYACANIGGSGLAANLRCMPTCSTDGDCSGAGAGPTCVAAKNEAGEATGSNACVAAKCE